MMIFLICSMFLGGFLVGVGYCAYLEGKRIQRDWLDDRIREVEKALGKD